MRKTKIICTIGPASASPETLTRLIDEGMDIARINMSHSDHQITAKIICQIREIAAAKNHPVAILMDTQGPAIRTGDLPAPVPLKPGDHFTFHMDGVTLREGECGVGVNYPGLYDDLNPGHEVIIDNGTLRMTVESKENGRILCRTLNEGIMGNRRHINLPGVRVNLPCMTEKDIADVRLGCQLAVDFISLSFCREADDIVQLRRFCRDQGWEPLLVAKIEDQEAVHNLVEIINESDAVMIARGDLGIECRMEDLPVIQRRIARTAISHFKPVIVATHMLESMITSPHPTRAEITDAANAVYEQVDAVMLSGETSVGRYPVECVGILSRIARRMEQSKGMQYKVDLENNLEKFLRSVVGMADELDSPAIMVHLRNGRVAGLLSSFRPGRARIYALTTDPTIARRLSLHRSVIPIITDSREAVEDTLMGQGYLFPGETVIILDESEIFEGIRSVHVRSAGETPHERFSQTIEDKHMAVIK
ncbi:pyruvate kinase [Oscillatoria laete-virens NRMC-F 0139]|nr:pyruvate kinase [Oscillatoria laete-virens]MDL5055361.1 pyruvate kinase [Oscillatoria laete-virens NRMC-F 0139]